MAGGANIPDVSSLTSDANYSDIVLSPDWVPPVPPDLSAADLPGQLPSFPGGSNSGNGQYSADPMGQNVLYGPWPAAVKSGATADPNPTPTGGWQSTAAAIVNLAAQGMRTYSAGSPSTAIPPLRRPVQSPSIFGQPGASKSGNLMLVGGIVVVGVIALIVLGVIKA